MRPVRLHSNQLQSTLTMSPPGGGGVVVSSTQDHSNTTSSLGAQQSCYRYVTSSLPLVHQQLPQNAQLVNHQQLPQNAQLVNHQQLPQNAQLLHHQQLPQNAQLLHHQQLPQNAQLMQQQLPQNPQLMQQQQPQYVQLVQQQLPQNAQLVQQQQLPQYVQLVHHQQLPQNAQLMQQQQPQYVQLVQQQLPQNAQLLQQQQLPQYVQLVHHQQLPQNAQLVHQQQPQYVQFVQQQQLPQYVQLVQQQLPQNAQLVQKQLPQSAQLMQQQQLPQSAQLVQKQLPQSAQLMQQQQLPQNAQRVPSPSSMTVRQHTLTDASVPVGGIRLPLPSAEPCLQALPLVQKKGLSFSPARQKKSRVPITVPPPARGDKEPGPRQLIVNYLAPEVTSEGLRELFAPFGDVEEARVVTDPTDGQSRAFGFVYFKRHVDAARAIDETTGRVLLGKRVRVAYAIPQRPVAELLWAHALRLPLPAGGERCSLSNTKESKNLSSSTEGGARQDSNDQQPLGSRQEPVDIGDDRSSVSSADVLMSAFLRRWCDEFEEEDEDGNLGLGQ